MADDHSDADEATDDEPLTDAPGEPPEATDTDQPSRRARLRGWLPLIGGGETDAQSDTDADDTQSASRLSRLPLIGRRFESDAERESGTGPKFDPQATEATETGGFGRLGAWLGRKQTTIGALLPSFGSIRPIRGLPGRIVNWVKLLLLGPSDTVGTRIGLIGAAFAGLVTLIGVFSTLGSGVETGSDSSWFVTTVLGVATSLWTYALLAVVLVAVFLYARRKRSAQRAAELTGFSVRSVRRLATEARTADGTSTIIASPSDTVHSSASRIITALESHHSVLDPNDRDVIDEDIVDAAETSAEAADETDLVVHDRANASVDERTRRKRLELASTLNLSDLFWSFGLPTMATFVALLIAVRFWVAVWVYPAMMVVSVMVGALWYVAVHRRRRTRAKDARQPETQPRHSDIAVLVKKVAVPETTIYMGWCGGTVYADYDELRLAWTLSEVAHAHIEGEPIPPTLQQKFWRELTQYRPNLKGREELERGEIIDDLVRTVADTDVNMLPKNKLCDRVIRRDKQHVGGVGYDPRLIGDAYAELNPTTLVEDTVKVESSTGDLKPLSIVRLRTKPLPRKVAHMEADFSVDYQPDFEPDFSLPDIDSTAGIADA